MTFLHKYCLNICFQLFWCMSRSEINRSYGNFVIRTCFGDFPGGVMYENLPAMQETWGQSQGQEDPLEKAIATHSRILTWRIPWTEEAGRLQSMESQSWT